MQKNHLTGVVITYFAEQNNPYGLEILRVNHRLLESIGNIPPAEFEMAYYHQLEESADAASKPA